MLLFIQTKQSNAACQQQQSVKKTSQKCPASLSALINQFNKVLNIQDASHHPAKGYCISEYVKIENEKALLLHNSTIKIKQGNNSPEFHH